METILDQQWKRFMELARSFKQKLFHENGFDITLNVPWNLKLRHSGDASSLIAAVGAEKRL